MGSVKQKGRDKEGSCLSVYPLGFFYSNEHLEVEREHFREAHYTLGGVRFSIAEYPDPRPTRAAAVMLGNLLAEKK